MTRHIIIPFILASTACLSSEQHGHLFAMREGTRADVVLHGARTNQGAADVRLASGEQCKGDFATTPDDVTWREEAHQILEEHSQSGMLVLACPTGKVITCQFVREHATSGYGKCKDTSGTEYSLTF